MAWGLFPAGFQWHYARRKNGTPIGTRSVPAGKASVPRACLDAAVLEGKGEPCDAPDDLGTTKAGDTVKRARKPKDDETDPNA